MLRLKSTIKKQREVLFEGDRNFPPCMVFADRQLARWEIIAPLAIDHAGSVAIAEASNWIVDGHVPELSSPELAWCFGNRPCLICFGRVASGRPVSCKPAAVHAGDRDVPALEPQPLHALALPATQTPVQDDD